MIPFTTCLCEGGKKLQDLSTVHSTHQEKVGHEEINTTSSMTAPSGPLGMKSSAGGWVVVTSSGHLVATSGVHQGRGSVLGAPANHLTIDSHKTDNQVVTQDNSPITDPDKVQRKTNFKRRGGANLYLPKSDKSTLYLRKFGPPVSKHLVYNPQQPLSHQPVPPFFGTDLSLLQHHHLTPSPISYCPSSSSSSSSQHHVSQSRLTSSFRHAKRNLSLRKAAYLDDISQGQTERLLGTIHRWNFSIFTLNKFTNGKALSHLCLTVFHEYNLVQAFDLDLCRLRKCLSLIEEGYHNNNPYHNALHAADVCQAMHCYMREPLLAKHLTPLEILSAFLASVFHDLDHPGVNQTFLISSQNYMSGLYENTSVLENHHWRYGISILRESKLLNHLSPSQRSEVEMQIKSLILATDIKRQQEFLTRFKSYLDDGGIEMTSGPSRHFVLQMALKCADISNPCRPWRESRKWSEKVTEEFFQQGDFERETGQTVTPLCDRFATTVGKIQHGFMEYVCLPLFRDWKRFNPSQLSDMMLENMASNQKRWKSQMEAEEALEERENCEPNLDLQKLRNSHLRRRHSGGELLVPRTHLKSGYSGRRGSGDEASLRHGHLNHRAAARRGSGDVDLLRRSLTHKAEGAAQLNSGSTRPVAEATSLRYAEEGTDADSPTAGSNASLASSKASSRGSSRASLTGCFIPSDFLPRRHSLPHVTSLTSGRPSSDGFSTPPPAYVCVESLMQSERDSFTTRKSITACRRSSMPLTPSQETFSAHCKALGIGNAVMERLHYIYGKALADKRGSHVSMLSAMGSPSSSVQDALDSLTDSSLQQTLCSKSSQRGSQRWRGIPLSSHRFSSRNTHSKTFPLEPWVHRSRVTTLTPNDDVSRLTSLFYHRVKKLNPYRRFSRWSHKRISLTGVGGGAGGSVIGAGTNGKCLEVGASGRVLETVPATPDPLHVTFDAVDPSVLSGTGALSSTSGGTLAVRPAHLETRSPMFEDGRSTTPPPIDIDNYRPSGNPPQIVVSCSANDDDRGGGGGGGGGGAMAVVDARRTHDDSLPTDFASSSPAAAGVFFSPDFSTSAAAAMLRTDADGCVVDAVEKTSGEDGFARRRAPFEKGRSDYVSMMTAPLAGATGDEGIYATSMPTPIGSASTGPTSSSRWTSGDVDDGTASSRAAVDAFTVHPDWRGEGKEEAAAPALVSERVVIQKHEQRLIVKTPEGEESEKVIVSRFSKSREASPALARRSSLRSSQSAGHIVGFGGGGGGAPSLTLFPPRREEEDA